MITSTFRHLAGVGPTLEARFWQAGLYTWEDALMAAELPCRRHENREIRTQLKESYERFRQGDALWFCSRLGAADQWRLYGDFQQSCVYLDIETTGLSCDSSSITTVCLWDGTELHHFVAGRNLDELPYVLSQYSLLVTFNGRVFDVPFLERELGVHIEMAHVDLRWAFKPLGFVGGLKRIEQSLGHHRAGLEGVDGRTAVYLWADYMSTGDERSLETLLAYNAEDAIVLEPLAIYVYNAYIKAFSLPLAELPACGGAQNPFTPSSEVLRRVGVWGA